MKHTVYACNRCDSPMELSTPGTLEITVKTVTVPPAEYHLCGHCKNLFWELVFPPKKENND